MFDAAFRRLRILSLVCLAITVVTSVDPLCAQSPRNDIRKLSQHFVDPKAPTAPWIFVPDQNIASLSTSEHPGVVTIWEEGKGHDIKESSNSRSALTTIRSPGSFTWASCRITKRKKESASGRSTTLSA
jgi:hypothetical protein